MSEGVGAAGGVAVAGKGGAGGDVKPPDAAAEGGAVVAAWAVGLVK